MKDGSEYGLFHVYSNYTIMFILNIYMWLLDIQGCLFLSENKNLAVVFVLQGSVPIFTLYYFTLIADRVFSAMKSTLIPLR